MYKPRKAYISNMQNVDIFEGEPIEHTIERMISNNEPITEGSELIYTEKADGVRPEFNIKTDRFELATEGKDLIEKNRKAKSEGKAVKEKEAKIVELKPKKTEDSGAEPTNGTSDSK